MPDAWDGIVLALAAFRLTRLLGWDDLTIAFRTWLCGITDDDYDALAKYVYDCQAQGWDPWAPDADGHTPRISPDRFYLAKLVHCPWCAGWWISLAVAFSWWAFPQLTLWVSLPLALSAVVGLVAKNLDP